MGEMEIRRRMKLPTLVCHSVRQSHSSWGCHAGAVFAQKSIYTHAFEKTKT